MPTSRELFASLVFALFAAGCAASPQDAPDSSDLSDAGSTTPADSGDGPVQRVACTATFGSALSSSFERVDGRLVAIVPPNGARACRADADHVHLQLLVNGATYDIAVTVNSATDPTMPEVYLHQLDAAPPGAPFSEGAHTGVSLDYVALGVHSSSFTPYPESQLVTMLESALADVDHISVYATGYTGGDGAHLVHRNGHGGTDGALVLHPLAASTPVLLFHFVTQSF